MAGAMADEKQRWDRTRREAEVLELVAVGLTNREIAVRLVVSHTTVRTHLENVFAKLNVHTRTAAVARLRATPAAFYSGVCELGLEALIANAWTARVA